MQTSTLRPGLLVSLKTSITGNVAYRTRDIETEHLEADGTKRAVWETERTIDDPAEHDEAIKIRSKCRSLIVMQCSVSAFGLLCPESAGGELGDAIREAQRLAQEFNESARLTRVTVYVIAGRIAQDDVQAVRAINSEVRDLLADMETGLKNLDVKLVREAATKAKNLGAMLTPDAAARIQIAIDAARSAARRIVKAAEEGAVEIDQAAIRAVTESRTAFLDMDEAAEIRAPEAEARGIDLAPLDEDSDLLPTVYRPKVAMPALELD